MEGLRQRIEEDLKSSMKARDKTRTSVLRMVLSEIKYAQVETDAKEILSDAEVAAVVQKYHKRLVKSLESFDDPERLDAIREEMKLVEEYCPKVPGELEIVAAIDTVIAQSDERNFGILMKEVRAKLPPTADGKTVSSLLKEKLSKL